MSKLNEVFGVSSKPVSSYIERESVDNHFKSATQSDKHVVVYGASKQGKTALVSRYIPYEDNVVIRLSSNSTIEDIYKSVLRQAKIEVIENTESERSIKGNVSIKSKIVAKIPFLGSANGEASAGVEAGKKTTQNYKDISINISLPQDVAETLREVNFNKFIILENFHYLDSEMQRVISFDLRNYQEMGIRFIILGVWRQKDKLRTYCPDLTDRIEEIAVEPWEPDSFRAVATKGAADLRAYISEAVVSKCIDNAFGSIGVFQELIKETCLYSGLTETADTVHIIDDLECVTSAISIKSKHYSQAHSKALQMIAAGNVTHTIAKDLAPLHLPYYLVKSILKVGFDGFSKGLDRGDLTVMIKEMHHRPENVRAGDMTNLLNGLSSLQFKKSINPPLIDYDEDNRRLFAIDSTFFFFLKNCDLLEFSDELPDPLRSSI